VARGPWYEKGNAWLTFCQIVMYPAAFLLGRKKVVGSEKLSRSGGYLLVANHISHLDPLYDSVVVRKAGRVPRFLAKASLWKVPVLGGALAGSEQIPVERSGAGAGQTSLGKATESLRNGKLVLIYPEGTVTRDPGHWPMKPRPGVGALALSGDFPVIPMAHWGTHQVYSSYVEGRRFHPLPRKDIHIVIGDPIDLTELRSRPVDTRAIRDATLLIMDSLRDLVAEIRHESPPKEYFDLKKAERLASRQAQKDAANAANAAAAASSAAAATDVTDVTPPPAASNGGNAPSPEADAVPADTASPPVAGRPQSGDEGTH
jgi:1-acyl-sn-glycerol-3-phosphate acyltransferase